MGARVGRASFRARTCRARSKASGLRGRHASTRRPDHRPASDLRAWHDGIERLSPATSQCLGLDGERWAQTHAETLDCVERFGGQAQDLRWTDLELFGVHPEIDTGRIDHCSALVPSERKAEAVTELTISFGALIFRRDKPSKPKGTPIWAFEG